MTQPRSVKTFANYDCNRYKIAKNDQISLPNGVSRPARPSVRHQGQTKFSISFDLSATVPRSQAIPSLSLAR